MAIREESVTFTDNKTAFIGYRLEINRDEIVEEGSLKFLLGNSEKPLTIRQVKISNNGETINGQNIIQTKNIAKLTDSYDFIVINTDHFANILIKDTLQSGYQYKIRMFPVERLYELDKLLFKISRKKIKSTQITQYDNRKIKFKKFRK